MRYIHTRNRSTAVVEGTPYLLGSMSPRGFYFVSNETSALTEQGHQQLRGRCSFQGIQSQSQSSVYTVGTYRIAS